MPALAVAAYSGANSPGLATGFVAGERGSSGRTPKAWWQMAWSAHPAGLGLGARASGAGGGWGGPGRLGSGAWLSGVGAQVGEGDVGVATTHVWTWLGA